MKLILGSQSPRRRELLRELGFDFEVRTIDTDESYPEQISVEEVPVFLAKKKAMALSHTLRDDEVLICADTVVNLNDQILGKPSDAANAYQMLSSLSGKVHQVITGVAIKSTLKTKIFSVTTKVEFHTLTDEIIRYYLDHYSPYDKAGAYGIQEWIGHVGVKQIIGSYSNVVGLPTHETFKVLTEFE